MYLDRKGGFYFTCMAALVDRPTGLVSKQS
jgi:hypothetical protein